MASEIINSICQSIRTEFGDKYKIYTDEVEQGLTTPCFFITCLISNKTCFLGKRYKHTNLFMIQFIPDEKEENKKCMEVSNALDECLEYLKTTFALIRGSNVNSEIVDGILNYKINYNYFSYQAENAEKMASYHLSQKTKEE